MSDEARAWLRYAEENLQFAQLLLQSALFNPALQHAQQAVEKFLKCVVSGWTGSSKSDGLGVTAPVFSRKTRDNRKAFLLKTMALFLIVSAVVAPQSGRGRVRVNVFHGSRKQAKHLRGAVRGLEINLLLSNPMAGCV